MCPSRVLVPVATTTPSPRPCVMQVPWNAIDALVVARGDGVGQHRGFVNWLGLAGERRLSRLELRDFLEPDVSRDEIARLEHDDVAGHEVGRGYVERQPIPAHTRRRRRQRAERCAGALGPIFLHGAE